MQKDKNSYQRHDERLIYLSHTKSNITYVVSVVSQFMYSPKKLHLKAIYWILQYLKESPTKRILFKKIEELSLEAYTKVDNDPLLIKDQPEATVPF